MEEVIAKSFRKTYIILYSILIPVSLLIAVFGAFLAFAIDEPEPKIIGWIFFVLGLILIGASIAWLVYFAKMPEDAIKLKDGKLYFRNGTVCAPTEVDFCNARLWGLDGAMFGFGNLLISVKGQQFKLKYIAQVNAVANRMFLLKAEYSVKDNIAKNQEAANAQPAVENTVPAQPVAAEEKINTEENNG